MNNKQRYLYSNQYRQAKQSLAYKLVMGTAAATIVMATTIAAVLVG